MSIGRLTGLFLSATVIFVGSLVPALAGDSRKVSFTEPVRFHGQAVPAGEYRLSWNLDPKRGVQELRLLDGKRVVATSPVHVVLLADPAPYASVVFVRDQGGERLLTELRFAGDREAIRVGDAAPNAEKAGDAPRAAESEKASTTQQ